MLLDRAVSHWDSLAKNAAARFKKSRSFRSISLSRFSRVSSSCSARTAWRVRPWDSTCCGSLLQRYRTLSEILKLPRHLGHRPLRFPRKPDRLRLECIGKLTSRCCGHADLQLHDAPTYGGVYEIEGQSVSEVLEYCYRSPFCIMFCADPWTHKSDWNFVVMLHTHNSSGICGRRIRYG